jgi:hypothetical protein
MGDTELIKQAVSLYPQQREKAAVIARRVNKRLRSLKDCYTQIEEWAKEQSHAPGEVDGMPEDTLEDVLLQSAKFDPLVLEIMRLHAAIPVVKTPYDYMGSPFTIAVKVLKGMVMLMRRGVNPSTFLPHVLDIAANRILDNTGVPAPQFSGMQLHEALQQAFVAAVEGEDLDQFSLDDDIKQCFS